MEWALPSIALSYIAKTVKGEAGFIHCLLEWSDSLFSFAVCFVFLFCGLIGLNFLLHLLGILKYYKGSAHVSARNYPRRNDLKGEGSMSVLSSVFLAASPLTLTTQHTRLYSFQVTPHTLSAGLYDRTKRLRNSVPAHKSPALSSPTTPGCCSLGSWGSPN